MPRNADLFLQREPSRYELAVETKRHVEELDGRIQQLENAIENSRLSMEAYLDMASQEEEAINANTTHLKALEAERSRYGSPADYQALIFCLRETGG